MITATVNPTLYNSDGDIILSQRTVAEILEEQFPRPVDIEGVEGILIDEDEFVDDSDLFGIDIERYDDNDLD